MAQVDEARRTSFDARAELYDEARPAYPDAVAEDVIARGGRRVLEIGAGTGKATMAFARRGASIVAIEPGAQLAAVLRRNVAGHDVTIEQTTFEAWPIARPFDIVMAAQAMHWVDPAIRYTKSAAVLGPGGTLAVLRNEREPFERELFDEIEAAYAQWHPSSSDRPLETAVECARREIGGEIAASGLFGPVDIREYPWTRTYTTAQYLDLLSTYSDHATLAPAQRERLFGAITAAVNRRGGTLDIRYVSMAFTARCR